MKVKVYYRENSEGQTELELFIREAKQRNPEFEVDMVEVDQGRNYEDWLASGCMELPSIVVYNQADDSVQASWQGNNLPLINDVLYYAQL